jgi:hypothetical protein
VCVAVGTASQQHESEAGTVYENPTVCSCRLSKSSAWVGSMYCVSTAMMKNDKAVSNQFILNLQVKYV